MVGKKKKFFSLTGQCVANYKESLVSKLMDFDTLLCRKKNEDRV